MNAYNLLASVLGLLGLWYLICYRWNEYRLDTFRDDVFALRDKLFMFAANGCIAFDHPAYTILRTRMNVLIRYAHEFTLARFVIVGTLMDEKTKSPALVRWEAAVKELPEEIQPKMEEFNATLAFVVVKQLVFSSFFLYVLLRPVVAIAGRVKVDVVVSRPEVVSRVEALESDALEQDDFASSRNDREAVVFA